MKQKKMMFIAVTILFIAILVGCAPPVYAPPPPTPPKLPDSRIVDLKTQSFGLPQVIIRPIIADLQVGQVKVVGEAEAPNDGADIAELKRLAILKALEKSNADILLEPMFDTTIKRMYVNEKKIYYSHYDSFTQREVYKEIEVPVDKGTTTVKVTGFPASYRNFKASSESDMSWIENQIQFQLQMKQNQIQQEYLEQSQRQQSQKQEAPASMLPSFLKP